MAGLIAANMLRRHTVRIWEKSPTLPSNHTAVLRFRTTAVSDATGIPFSHQVVHKGFWKDDRVVNEVTIEDMNRYSLIVTGGHLYQRSVFNLNTAERWCAPRDFVEQMARKLDIELDMPFVGRMVPIDEGTHIISTMPMPLMMGMHGYNGPEFKSLPVWTIKTTFAGITSSVCQTLYQATYNSWYRATIHGQELTLEFMFDPSELMQPRLWVDSVMHKFGMLEDVLGAWKFGDVKLNRIHIGKILPIDEAARKRFMLWLTEKHGIYSLGRFATWRNILLDDIVKDVKRIEQMIEKGHTYDER